MTFDVIFSICSYAVIGIIACFCAYLFIGMIRQESVLKGIKKLEEIKNEKVKYLNAELAAYDVQIFPKDEGILDSGRIQSLTTLRLVGEYSLLSDELSNGDEVYRFILKDKTLANGLIEINLDEKLNENKPIEVKKPSLQNKFVKEEYCGLKGKKVSALKHSYLENNKVEPFKGLIVAAKNLTLKHTTINSDVQIFKISKGDLLIPAMNVNKEFITYQVVDANHNKRMRIGKSLTGGFFPVGEFRAENEKYILCEDYLSAYTLYKSTGITSLVCFDIQNIINVAKDLIDLNPDVEFVFATSRDMLTRNKSCIRKGLYYSNLFDMPFIFPKFPDGAQYEHFKTWNELQRYESNENIKAKVDAQIKFFKDNGKISAIRLASDKYGIKY